MTVDEIVLPARLPMGPLLHKLSRRHLTIADLCDGGINITRSRPTVTVWAADRACAWLDMHPAELWPEWAGTA